MVRAIVQPLAAANRVGEELVSPCAENGGQTSALVFYGSSFLTDETGEIVARANREDEGVLIASYDFARIRQERRNWNVFRDRRPECYTILTK